MTILINDKQHQTEASTLAALAEELQLPRTGVAMAVDMQMVQRDDWATTALTEGAKVFIIKAACGG